MNGECRDEISELREYHDGKDINEIKENSYETRQKKSDNEKNSLSTSWSPRRERHNLSADNHTVSFNGGKTAAEQYVRLFEMHEMGKSKIVIDRQRYENRRKEATGRLNLILSNDKSSTKRRDRTSGERQMRLSEMYEMGKSKILTDRERYTSDVKIEKLSKVKKIDAVAQDSRVMELYEKGKNKLFFNREHHESEQKCERSPKIIPINEAQNRLYELSKEKQVRGRKRREEVEKAIKLKGLNLPKPAKIQVKAINRKVETNSPDETDDTPRYLQWYESGRSKLKSNKVIEEEEKKPIPSGQSKKGTCLRLYKMSKHMRENGKDRREEIEKPVVQLCRVTMFS